MGFKPIKYMEWVKNRGHAQTDLCPSGVSNLSLKELGINSEDLEIYGENSYGYLPLIQAIANRYQVHEDNVMLSVGTSFALFMVCALLLNRKVMWFLSKNLLMSLSGLLHKLLVGKSFDSYREYEQGYVFNLDELETRRPALRLDSCSS